ncbi:hypothetical protein AMST5_01323 [freshwater sediment metagenome]|uniref:OmpA-like domain-containing protein n=1 Tax=freshwater sediment metagenome TaxID=556182 RepID=A0AA48M0Q4_9ZZZZ
MTTLCRLAVTFLLWIVATTTRAQTTEEIIEKLDIPPKPIAKGIPVTDPTGKSVILEGESPPPSINLNILFDYDSDRFTQDAFRTLRNLGAALKDVRLAKSRFKIAGHTDAKGNAEYNQKLSEKRAQAVRDYLIFQYDVEPSRIEFVGYGKSQLADPAHPEDGANRRVQVINLGSTR